MGVNFSSPRSELKPGELAMARNCHYKGDSGQLVKTLGRGLFGTVNTDTVPVTGLSYCRFISKGSYIMASAGTGFYSAPIIGAGTGEFTIRASGLNPVGRMEAVYFNGSDSVYMSDGINRMQVWDGTASAARNAGGELPAALTAAVALASSSNTNYILGTVFSYCYTEYNSVTGVESPPSAVSRVQSTVAGADFKITIPATLVNSGFDKIRLYRTQFGGNVFYRLAEFTFQASAIYYDGTNSDAGSPAITNNDTWGFDTVDDIFLSSQPVASMVGEPLRSNYMTINGIIPKGEIMFLFENALVITGIPSFPQDVYYSQADFPENFSPVDFVREENSRGEPVTGGGVANDRMIIFTVNSIFRHNTLPRVTDPGFGLGLAVREEVTDDHGCVAKRTVVNFGAGQQSNRLFYLSARGPMHTDGYETQPLYDDLDWDSRLFNFGSMPNAVAINYPKYSQIRLFLPSAGSSTNDICMIYHYHPRHLKRGSVGKWTGPIHVRCAAAAVAHEADSETRLFIADTNTSAKVYQEDTGTKDEQFYENTDGDIHWEWETGDYPFGEESLIKHILRIFLSVIGTEDFSPTFKYAINKNDDEHKITLANQSNNKARNDAFGTSSIKRNQTRSYRGGIHQRGNHLRLHMNETAIGEREIASIELEIRPYGRQR